VPLTDDDGIDFSLGHHKEWDRKVRAIANGLTIYKPARGTWLSPVTMQYHEEYMIPVKIIATKEQMEQILDITVEHYKQEAVIAFKLSEDIITRWARDANGK